MCCSWSHICRSVCSHLSSRLCSLFTSLLPSHSTYGVMGADGLRSCAVTCLKTRKLLLLLVLVLLLLLLLRVVF